IVLLLGQIVLALNFVNKENETGWILHRLSYVTLFVVLLALVLIAGSGYLASFYIYGAGSLVAGAIISSICLSMVACFGSCLSSICYHTLKIKGIWRSLQ
ncbi:MAG: hypothetical protein P1Q69_15950, partial [Candidatus Thorarchaeota archaeon]|nr:hypothetical protein [Candidatus Thorarchaeota archaeon]